MRIHNKITRRKRRGGRGFFPSTRDFVTSRDTILERPKDADIITEDVDVFKLDSLVANMEEPDGINSGSNKVVPVGKIKELINILSKLAFIPYELQERIKKLRKLIKSDSESTFLEYSIIGFLVMDLSNDLYYQLSILLLQKTKGSFTRMTSLHLTNDDLNVLAAQWCNNKTGSIKLAKINSIVSNLTNIDRAAFNTRLLGLCKNYTKRGGRTRLLNKTKKRRISSPQI